MPACFVGMFENVRSSSQPAATLQRPGRQRSHQSVSLQAGPAVSCCCYFMNAVCKFLLVSCLSFPFSLLVVQQTSCEARTQACTVIVRKLHIFLWLQAVPNSVAFCVASSQSYAQDEVAPQMLLHLSTTSKGYPFTIALPGVLWSLGFLLCAGSIS